MSNLAAFVLDDDEPVDNAPADPEVVRLLVEECLGHSENAEIALLEFDEESDPVSTIEDVLRAFHSLKGAAAVVGAEQIGALTHHAELILERCRDGEIAFTSELRCELGEHARLAKQVMHQLADLGKEPEIEFEELTRRLEDCAGRQRDALPDKATKPTAHLPVKVGTQVRINKKDYDIFVGQTDFFLDFLRTHLLPNLTEISADRPIQPQDINDVIEDIVGGIEHFEQALDRVKTERFEAICNLLERYVKDTAQRCQKSIEWRVSGHDIGIERTVLNGLLDPMMHLIRNAVDHGIEDAEDREAKGKPETGRVEIIAAESDAHWMFEISDDGQGIQVDKVVEKALKNDVVSEVTLASMTRAQKLGLIFAPGLSTAVRTTEISGRGMGADIVHAAIGTIGGQIEITSTQGNGTRFNISVPKSASKRLAAQLQYAKGQAVEDMNGAWE